MTVNIKTPIGLFVSIQPDVFADVCPIWFLSGKTTREQRKAVRRYCDAEGWIDLAERRFVVNTEIKEFLNSLNEEKATE